MTTLVKSPKITYIVGTPESAGQPWVPAHWAEVTTYAIRPVYITVDGTGIGENSGKTALLVGYEYVPVTTRTWIPEQPYIAAVVGVPARLEVDLNLGWNSGAYSRRVMVGPGRFTFTCPGDTSGAVVGLTDNPEGAGYLNILYAWYITNGLAYVMERGTLQSGEKICTGETVFAVERSDGEIKYLMDGATVQTATAIDAPLVLDVSLYSGGDRVIDADYEELSYGYAALELAPLQALGADGDYGEAALSFPPLVASGNDEYGYAALELGPLQALGSDFDYGEAALALAPLTVAGSDQGLLIPEYGHAAMTFPPLEAGGYAFADEEYGYAALSLPPLAAKGADGDYGDASLELAPMEVYGEGYAAPGQVIGVMCFASDFTCKVHTNNKIKAAMRFAADFTCKVRASNVVKAQMRFSADFTATVKTNNRIPATLLFAADYICKVVTRNPDASGELVEAENFLTWVLNQQFQTTRYAGYGFNSYAQIGGKYYGCKDDGLYLLDGDDDAGKPIKAAIMFGLQDFGTSAKKRLAPAYATTTCDGGLSLQVRANDDAYLYPSRGSALDDATRRFDIGKGICASRIGFAVANENGADFELVSLELNPLNLGRRI